MNMRRPDPARLVPQLLAPVAALLVAAGISAVILGAEGHDALDVFRAMADSAGQPDTQVDVLNKAIPYYIAAVAAAFGFRMGLFNIGVEGQYRLATLFAAALGSASFTGWMPGPLRIVSMVLVAVAVGGIWAGVAGLLKVSRGVSEVISTIMLNAIAGGLVAWLNTTDNWGIRPKGGNAISTRILPKDTWLDGLPLIGGTSSGVYAFGVVAVVLGVAYWFLVSRTRFGFDLRAAGYNPNAAAASGVDARRMVVITMVLSGAVAGLVGMPQLFGLDHAYTESVGGIGFTGIAVALLGRNHPLGMAFGAMLWAFLDCSPLVLEMSDVSGEIVTIMQGTTVLAVVIIYEVAARITKRLQQRRAGLAGNAGAPGDGTATAGPAAATPASESEETR